jgi:hypothetical protein
MTPANQSAIDYLKSLAEQGFWGTVALKFQSGQIIHVVKEESLKPEELIPENRRTHANFNSSLAIPAAVVYRKTGRETDTPDIVFDSAPRLNILATSSEEWFFRNLAVEDSAGGFVPRWLMVRVTGLGRDVPIPAPLDKRFLEPLSLDLRELDGLRGAADLSRVHEHYRAWYSPAKKRFAGQPNTALAMTFFNRYRGHILKLAVIYEASRSCSLNVSEESWQRAVQTADAVEQTIFSLLDTGMSAEGYAISQMEDRVRLAGADGIALSDFTRAFQNDRTVREQRLKTLFTSETFYAFSRKTAGRPAAILVHSSAASDYQARHPEDKRCWLSP